MRPVGEDAFGPLALAGVAVLGQAVGRGVEVVRRQWRTPAVLRVPVSSEYDCCTTPTVITHVDPGSSHNAIQIHLAHQGNALCPGVTLESHLNQIDSRRNRVATRICAIPGPRVSTGDKRALVEDAHEPACQIEYT